MSESEDGSQDVLIAEDDRDDFEVIEDVIKTLPLKIIVTRADNGDVLMELINEKTPDLLLLDLMLPRKDGRTCIREIRSDKKFDNLPIIVYTSVRDLESVEFCFRAGANLYVFKPDTYTGIVEAVQKIFAFDWKKVSYFPARDNYILNPQA